MIPHQQADGIPGFLVPVESVKDLLRQLHTPLRVAVKMADAPVIQGKAVRLSQIVEQQRPADNGIGPAFPQRLQSMLPHVPIVEGIAL